MVAQRIRTIFAAIVLSGVMAFSQDVGTPPSKALNVDVELVTVDVAVTDSVGRHVSGLDQQHFRLWEDKIEQKIEYFASEDSPVTVGIIFDVSASMKSNLEKAKEAALTFLASGNRDDEYFLVQFSDRPKLVQDFTGDLGKVKSSLITMSAKGATSLYDAVYLGLIQLKSARHTKKALLVISDGDDNRSRYSFNDLKRFAAEQDVKIYSICIDTDFGPPIGGGLFSGLDNFLFGVSALAELAEVTGGEAYFPRSVSRMDDLCRRIAAALKSQYSIAYRSTNVAKDGAWRKVTVKLSPPHGMSHLNMKSKKGYYAATTGVVSAR